MKLWEYLIGYLVILKKKVDDKKKSKRDNILIENIMFKNVNGIDFNMVRIEHSVVRVNKL